MDITTLYIGGDQAIKLLRAARAKDVVTAHASPYTDVKNASPVRQPLAELGIEGLLDWLNIGPRNPLHLLVPNRHSRVWIPDAASSLLSCSLPKGAFMELSDGTGPHAMSLSPRVRILVASPALALIHASNALQKSSGVNGKVGLEALLSLIALASEFCGSYAKDPLAPTKGAVYYDRPHHCERFTTPEELTSFLSEVPSALRGIRLARRAASWAIDESGSPMETYLNHALTLPPRLGGLSMPTPLANKQLVTVGQRKAKVLKHESIRPDFQWPDLNTLAEYLGEKDHSSKGARIEDKNRLHDYSSSGYAAFYLMFDDVKSVAALNKTAMMLARSFAEHGKPYEPYRLARLLTREHFAERQVKLVKRLLPPLLRYAEAT